jgi:hypothetical protein
MNAAPILSPTTFAELWHLGYGPRLLPIVPPNAAVSDRSTLSKRVGTPQDGRGKTPGVRGQDGKWHSFDWQNHDTLFADLARWGAMRAGVGCRMGSGLAAIDADTLDKVLAALIQQTCINHFSVLPTRIGNFPKAMYLIRVSGPFPYKRVEFGDKERVEILTEGKQAVFAGVHPKTGAPYSWPFPLVAFDQLPVVSPEQLTAFLHELSTILPAAKPVITEGAGNEVSQASLRGELAAVRKAVTALPNTSEAFPTRETWYMVGYAIKGALQDHPEEAFELFAEWSSRWTENGEPASPGNDPAYVEAEWTRFKPPFKVGASKIYELAEHHAPEQFKKVDAFFDEIPEPTESLFAPETTEKTPPIPVQPLVAGRVNASQLDRLSPRQWLYGTKISRKYVTFLASPGGVGKTAYVIAMALAAASGTELLHDKPRKPLRVWIYNLEDDELEIRRRLAAAFRHFGLSQDVLDNVRINSGRSRRFQIVKTGQHGEFIAQPDYRLVIDELKREGIDIFFVDPYLRSHGVSENENEAQDEVMRLYAQIAEEANCGIVLVHHTKKGGASGDMESLRGGSTQGGGARAAYTLAPMAADEALKLGVPEALRRTYVRIDDAKNNMAPPSANAEWLHLESVRLGNGDADYPLGDNVQVAAKWTPPDAWEGFTGSDETAALARIGAGLDDGERYSARAQDKDRWAGAVLVDMGRSDAQAKEMIAAWLRRGLLELKDYMSEKQRKTRKGLFCNQPEESGVFA